MWGVTPLSSSASVHFLRVRRGMMVIERARTSTLTCSPALRCKRSTASWGIRKPRLLPQRETVLCRRTLAVAELEEGLRRGEAFNFVAAIDPPVYIYMIYFFGWFSTVLDNRME